jgi:hypothetical protein
VSKNKLFVFQKAKEVTKCPESSVFRREENHGIRSRVEGDKRTARDPVGMVAGTGLSVECGEKGL